jgi:alkylation response protein AidB-like acyl-CoA dehydrogenase
VTLFKGEIMDFSLSEEQEILKKSASDFLAKECPKALVKEMEKDERGFPKELWDKMAKLGWMGLIFPEEYEGTGSSFLDLAVLLEEMGKACLPSPFFSSIILGGSTLLEAGNEEQKREILPEVAMGRRLLTLALTEQSAKYTSDGIQAKARKEDEYIIDGIKLFIPDAHIADDIICVARTGEGVEGEGISLFLVDAKSPGITCNRLLTIAGDKQFEVIFDGVRTPRGNTLGEADEGWAYIENVWPKIVIAKCAEMVGGAQQTLEMTVNYAKERIQFGQPIGNFQVIQHYCANMLADVDSSRFVTYQAAWMIGEGIPCKKEVAVAKTWVSEAFRRVTALAHQIHGTIGYTEDHDLHLFYKRAKAWELSFGGADFHLDIVAQEIGLK